MVKLEIEINDKMVEKLQCLADYYAVDQSDIAKSILAKGLIKPETPSLINKLLQSFAVAVAKTIVPEKERGKYE